MEPKNRKPSSQRSPQWLLFALHVATLCAFAIAQPLFDILGKNASFFVAHRASGPDVLLLVAVASLGPPLVLTLVLWGLTQVSGGLGAVLRIVVIGSLGALAVVPPVVRAGSLSWPIAAVLTLAIGSAVAFAYARRAGFRRFLSVLSPAVLLFAVLFVFVSEAKDLVFADAPSALVPSGAKSDVPVIAVLFDELSLSSLITPGGQIDEERFPGFARLAGLSTWYRDATTVGLRTDQAVPAILTGRRVPRRQVPSSFTYPQNIFTLLSETHEFQVHEFVTEICPPELCPPPAGDRTSGLRALFSDAAIVYGHVALPEDAAGRLLPPLGDRWAGFSREGGNGADGGADPVRSWLRAALTDARSQHEGVVFERFLEDLPRSGGRPGFSWLHVQVPHPPWRYLPSGQTYPAGDSTPGYRNFRWSNDQYLADEVLQRSLLQTKFADVLTGRLLDRLEETGQLDETMVVVVADHGATWEAGQTRRDVDGPHGAALLGVPLFVKYPGQGAGTISTRNAETVDIVPTIADVTGVELPWRTHGSSLRGKNARDAKRVFDGERERVVDTTFADVRRFATYIRDLFGPAGDSDDDLYAFGKNRHLLGRKIDNVGSVQPSVTVSFDGRPFSNVDVDAGTLPVFFRGRLSEGVRDHQSVVVALNGRVAGVGNTYREDGATRVAMILSPRYLRDGRNDIQLYAYADDTFVVIPKR